MGCVESASCRMVERRIELSFAVLAAHRMELFLAGKEVDGRIRRWKNGDLGVPEDWIERINEDPSPVAILSKQELGFWYPGGQ
ncbi:hypothetical protein ACLOJK_001365 [Asimina triloba]